MLAPEEHSLQDGLETAAVHLKKGVRAEANDRLNQLEKAFSELRVRRVLSTDHLKSGRQQVLQDGRHEALKHGALLAHHGGEHLQHFWVPCVWI